MINVVFDFGQVLVHYEPSYMVSRYTTDPEDAALLEEVVFDRFYWDRLDAGTISDTETVEAFRTRLPERLWALSERIYYEWIYNIPEMEGMREVILHIKQKYNASVYLLSNISRYFVAHSHEIPILSLVDKCIFSSTCGMVKPNPNIFKHLCSECELLPSQTVFVDDRPENVEGARSIGMVGYCFDGDAEKLRKALDDMFGKADDKL